MLVNTTFDEICDSVDNLWDVLNNVVWERTYVEKDWSKVVDAIKLLEDALEISRDENGEYYCTAV